MPAACSRRTIGATLARIASRNRAAVLIAGLLLTLCSAVNGQNPTPSKEYIRLGGRVIAVESALPQGGAPATPTGLGATAGNTQVVLTWNAITGLAYNVFRGTASGGEGATPIATGLTAGTYADKSLNDGTTYYYKVEAVNASGISWSYEVRAIPLSPYAVFLATGQPFAMTPIASLYLPAFQSLAAPSLPPFRPPCLNLVPGEAMRSRPQSSNCVAAARELPPTLTAATQKTEKQKVHEEPIRIQGPFLVTAVFRHYPDVRSIHSRYSGIKR